MPQTPEEEKKELKRTRLSTGVMTAALTSTMIMSASSQLGAADLAFTEKTGADNPADSIDVGFYATPAFVDIDGDGDFDLFVGNEYGYVYFFENTGTDEAPVFTQVDRLDSNPLAGFEAEEYAAPAFVDIDGDGDFDVFIGKSYWGCDDYGYVYLYENIGTASVPDFGFTTIRNGGLSNPLGGIDFGYGAKPAFADLNDDGLFDAFIGNKWGEMFAYKNIGTAAVPEYEEWDVLGGDKLRAETAHYYGLAPAFVDIDGDGDLDLFVGTYVLVWDEPERQPSEAYSMIVFIENTGTAASPVFAIPEGAGRTARAADDMTSLRLNFDCPTPAFVDIDGDGDMDAFVGDSWGKIHFFQNNASDDENPECFVGALFAD